MAGYIWSVIDFDSVIIIYGWHTFFLDQVKLNLFVVRLQ